MKHIKPETDSAVRVFEGVWFNIVLKNKLTKITLKCNRRKKRKDPDYKHSLPAGGGIIAVLMSD